MSGLRPAISDDLEQLSALCLRSKAHWGYDAAFMAACREELTVTPRDLADDLIMVCDGNGTIAAMVQLAVGRNTCELDRLYVDPSSMGKGHGSQLMRWAIDEAVRCGAARMRIDADPNARAFYEKFGAILVGESPSGSIPGRMLPQLEINL